MKIVIVLFLLFLFPCFIFAKGKVGHGNDILYVLYDYEDEDELEAKGTDKEKLAYFIVRDAVALAIDEQGIKKVDTQKHLDDLKENLRKTKFGKNITLPSSSEFPSLGMGQHRAYNHQGFYYDYRDKNDPQKYFNRWMLGRDRVLIPAVSAAFDIPLGDYKAEALAIIFYYVHMAGDLCEGQESSVRQLKPINTYSRLIDDFDSAERKILKGKQRKMFISSNIYNAIKRIKNSVSHIKDREQAYRTTIEFFKRDLKFFIISLLQ